MHALFCLWIRRHQRVRCALSRGLWHQLAPPPNSPAVLPHHPHPAISIRARSTRVWHVRPIDVELMWTPRERSHDAAVILLDTSQWHRAGASGCMHASRRHPAGASSCMPYVPLATPLAVANSLRSHVAHTNTLRWPSHPCACALSATANRAHQIRPVQARAGHLARLPLGAALGAGAPTSVATDSLGSRTARDWTLPSASGALATTSRFSSFARKRTQ